LAPRLSRAVQSRRVAALLERLADSARAGRPIPGALATLARHHYDPSIRNKLLLARNEVELGAEVWPAMRGAQVLAPPEVAVLEAAEKLGVRGWALEALAATRDGQAVRRMTWQSSVLWFAALGIVGLFVLAQAVAMFSILSSLITRLA
jgi:type II secretory pathway component PulF